MSKLELQTQEPHSHNDHLHAKRYSTYICSGLWINHFIQKIWEIRKIEVEKVMLKLEKKKKKNNIKDEEESGKEEEEECK